MTDYHPEYEAIYQEFPRRNGQRRGKGPGYKKWLKLTAAEKLLCKQDIEKRNRQHGWGKYIVDISRYMNEKMWEEDWEPYTPDEGNKDKPNRGPVNFTPTEQKKAHWADLTFGRLYMRYIMPPAKLITEAQVEEALEIKREMWKTDVPALQEDIDAKETTVADASRELGIAFLRRLDSRFGRNDAERVLAISERARAPWKNRG